MDLSWALTDGDSAKRLKTEIDANGGAAKAEDGEADAPKSIMKDIASLALQTSRGQAHMEGAFYRNFQVNEDFPLIPPCVLAGKSYTEATKGKKGHGMGSPHVHVAITGLQKLHGMPGVNQKKLEMFTKEHNTREAIQEAIPIFFVSKQYEEKKYKIT